MGNAEKIRRISRLCNVLASRFVQSDSSVRDELT
jgi:hypothetical protein